MQAEDRSANAEELVLPQAELDNMSNFFLDCVYSQRKSLRHKLLRLKTPAEEEAGNTFQQSSLISNSMDPNGTSKDKKGNNTKLLETYLSIVRTGAPDEIEKFAKIERQKLVELLCTNTDLLNFMFDKMFVPINGHIEN